MFFHDNRIFTYRDLGLLSLLKPVANRCSKLSDNAIEDRVLLAKILKKTDECT